MAESRLEECAHGFRQWLARADGGVRVGFLDVRVGPGVGPGSRDVSIGGDGVFGPGVGVDIGSGAYGVFGPGVGVDIGSGAYGVFDPGPGFEVGGSIDRCFQARAAAGFGSF